MTAPAGQSAPAPAAPGLARFFAAAGRYLADPTADGAVDAFVGAFPGWAPPRARVSLYGAMVVRHVTALLDVIYPHARAAVVARAGEDAWAALGRAHYGARPARRFELNDAARSFPETLAAGPNAGAPLPGWLPDLARLEWALFAAYQADVEVPAAATPTAGPLPPVAVNPTAEPLELAWRVGAWLPGALAPGGPGVGASAPEPGPEVCLVWRHPTAHTARYLAAGARALLALKLAVEGIAPADAAAAGGVAPAEVEAALREHLAGGLLVPAPAGSPGPG